MQNTRTLTYEFWNKLKKLFQIDLFGYKFVFSLASYFSARNFQSPYFPQSNSEGVGIYSHFSEANVLSLLRYVYSQDVCLFYYGQNDLEEFFLKYLDHLSPVILNVIRDSVVVALKKYIKDISDFIYVHERNFSKDELRTLWIVYKDKFDREFLDENFSHPLFFSWYFRNKEQDFENEKLKDEENIFIQNPDLYSKLKERGYVGNLSAGEKEDMITEIKNYAEFHRKQLKKTKGKLNG